MSVAFDDHKTDTLDEWVDDEPDPTVPSLTTYVASGHAFILPWSHTPMSLATGFESSAMKQENGPWIPQSPFDEQPSTMRVMLSDLDNWIVTYRDGMSSQSGSNTEHLSVTAGVTIGYSFLNANVSGSYDQHIQRNSNSVQRSQNYSCRAGRATLPEVPKLSCEARSILCAPNGVSRFREKYGEYYVWGYDLGCDAGVCLSGSSKSSHTTERLALTVSVKVLWRKESHTESRTVDEMTAAADFDVCYYNSLDQSFGRKSTALDLRDELSIVQSTASDQVAALATLDLRFNKKLKETGVKHASELPVSKGQLLCESGLVVGLILAPYERLNEYVELVCGPKRKSQLGTAERT